MSDVVEWGRKHRAKKEHKRAHKAGRRSTSVASRASMRPAPEPKGTLAPLDLSNDLVVVSVPTYRMPASVLRRAVDSVLSGTHKNVRVVVISDGDSPPSWQGLSADVLGDPRLVCLASPRNAGPYFNHDIVLRAAAQVGAPLFAIQDSDDESFPTRFERLLDTMHGCRCESVHANLSQVEINGRRHPVVGSAASGEAWAHRANHFGLYNVATLMMLGGYHAGFRVGYDTNMTSFLNLLTTTRMAPGALYTRHRRSSSLTRSPETGHGSRLRRAHKATLRAMWEAAHRKARISRGEAARYIRETAIRRSRETGLTAVRNALVEEAVSRLQAIQIEAPPVHPALLKRIIDGVSGLSDWAVTRELAAWMYRLCEQRKPRTILDIGSGMSTAALALYAARTGARLVSLEHDKRWYDVIAKKLERMGLRKHVELVCAPLSPSSGGPFYHVALQHLLAAPVDLVLIDGPPRDLGGRGAVMGSVLPYLHPGSLVLVHDAARAEESADVERWRARATLQEVRTAEDARGLAVLEIS